MIIGIPKEIKREEKRVAITPEGVSALVGHGHRVIIETGAGLGSGMSNEAYQKAGAEVLGKAFLYLKSSAEHLDYPWDFAQSYNLAVRDIGHVTLAEKGEQMMLAKAVYVHVLHDDHFIVFFAEYGPLQDFSCVLPVA